MGESGGGGGGGGSAPEVPGSPSTHTRTTFRDLKTLDMTPCLPGINGIVPWDGAGKSPTLQVIYLQGGKLPERSVQGPIAAEGGR